MLTQLRFPVLLRIPAIVIAIVAFSVILFNELGAAGSSAACSNYTFGDQDQQKQKKSSKKSESRQSKWKLDCIVLDAGHGGGDPGAIGTKGVREKKVVLGIVLKLGALIKENMPGVKVVYTRKDDRFIELDRRGRIANNAGGKLFISVHANSTEQKPIKSGGFEVYLLRPGRTEEAMRIAEFENSVVKLEKDYESRYQRLTDEQFIIINMAQSAYMKYSERFADLLNKEMRSSKKIRSLGVKQAGFYVLVGASMPNVLIETAFLSNLKEEAFLASEEGQQFFAQRIFNAIQQYAREYDKSLDE
jgi:N-acetylmuramoyl-L-alanine amidase